MAVERFSERRALNISPARVIRTRWKEESGSISILVFGLFFLMIALVFVLTDLASIIVAQRSLVGASENAVIQAAHVLDRDAYYKGNNGVDVPLDCDAAQEVVLKELEAWSKEGTSIRRPDLSRLNLEDFYCSGDELEITTSAVFMVPFVLPGSQLRKQELRAKVGASSRRAN